MNAMPRPQPQPNQNGDDGLDLLFAEGDSDRFVTYVGWSQTISATRTQQQITAAVCLPPRMRGVQGRFLPVDDAEEEEEDDEDNNEDEENDEYKTDRRIAKTVRVFFKETSQLVASRGFES